MDRLPQSLILLLLTTSTATGGRRVDFRHGGFPKFPVSAAEDPSVRGDFPTNIHSCGRTSTPRIVGGATATYGNNPWQVQLEVYKNGDGFSHHCGGAIISPFHIVTAAHCLQVPGVSPHDYRVKVGDHDLTHRDQDEQMFEVEGWTIHPKFGVGGIYNNDVAVVKVKGQRGKGFQMSRFVTPACLPSSTTPYAPGTKCQVSGWGLTDPDNNFSKVDVLHSTEVLLMADNDCQKMLGTRGYGSGMICAGYMEGKKDACNGDSGGPLACNIDGSYTLLGVVSWGKNCGKPHQPGVYTHIQHYLEWIQSVL
ncbi:serine protease 30-like [Homarus americanus]|uniref:serine protease 30-like n=1 Tax=Homarus americanus TaxID=6706 RepID=UPI001C456430|nr:serine protease 30-like [Homarus americanus]